MLDYLETGLFRGRPAAAPSPHRGPRPPHRRPRPPDRPASGVRRLLADGRVLAVAAVVAVALAVLAGTSVPLHSPQAGPGRPPVSPSPVNPSPVNPSGAPQSPGTSAAPSPAQPAATPPASPPARSTASPGGTSPGGTSPGGTSPGAAGTGPYQATPSAAARTSAGASAAAPHRAARAATAVPAVVVTFTVTSRGGGIFEGEVRIVDNGTSPLANWQVSVALPGDRVVAVANASGFVIHGILLLEPAAGATPVPPRGGVLNVFFVAAGPQPISGACAYNQSPCA